MTIVVIRDEFDRLEAQRRTMHFASALGFGRRACHELAIVASELSSNILKYGKRGRLELVEVNDADERGIAVKAHDSGPPFRDLATALRDGYHDAGPIVPEQLWCRKGIGAGLGAVVRLTHSFRVETGPGGKCVIATRYLGRPVSLGPRSGR